MTGVHLRSESGLFDVLTSRAVMVSLRVNNASVVSRDFYTLHVRTQFIYHSRHVTQFNCLLEGQRLPSWLRGSVVERRSSAGELSLSCARLAADG